MKFEHTVRYAASVEEVYAMLTDPAFREKVSLAQHALEVTVSVEDGEVVLDLEQPNRDLPGFARAFAGETTRAVTTEGWRDGSVADFHVETPGRPTSITGTRRLVTEGDATLDVFLGEARVKVPLVGGRIEGLMVSRFKEGRDGEQLVGATWLAGER